MSDLGPVAWPPAPIRTERLVLREPEATDRTAVIELLASPEVGTYVGGPQPREDLERAVPEVPRRRPGLFVVDLDGAMIGFITLDRRDSERPGHVRTNAGEAELGYMFLPHTWGRGYAAEACAAVLDWFAGALPGEPVVLCTQTANVASMRLAAKLGFTEVERFEEYGPSSGSAAGDRIPHHVSVRIPDVVDCEPAKRPSESRDCRWRPTSSRTSRTAVRVAFHRAPRLPRWWPSDRRARGGPAGDAHRARTRPPPPLLSWGSSPVLRRRWG
ncbi:RimJ/RimL family protein N-acetyltransferase [Actinopolymorpha rutila]|uniref:RimJ/RimL family protein N-acetyltransferase n=1 Tax=Actinopolymorpha rutila TaxID=446787 RepID=A0A852ZMI1_9ACTN|nr:GNAT family N-acetyltransferase [Actinopolymorpha rutila]NYH90360.1 RimJ/RimL family protein N-acetyltransferase [Actinopolymorpha rutila]